MSGCHAATVTRCDSRTDFGACPCCDYSAAGEPFGVCPCRGYSATAREPFRRLPLSRVQRESSRLLYNSSSNPAANHRTSTMPIIFFSFVNRRRLSGLVRTSASCRPVLTNSMMIYPPSIQSLRKWNLTSMCFLRSWRTGFFARAMAGWLSTISASG